MGFAGGFFTNIIGSAFDGFVYEETGKPVVGGLVFEMLERMGLDECSVEAVRYHHERFDGTTMAR